MPYGQKQARVNLDGILEKALFEAVIHVVKSYDLEVAGIIRLPGQQQELER